MEPEVEQICSSIELEMLERLINATCHINANLDLQQHRTGNKPTSKRPTHAGCFTLSRVHLRSVPSGRGFVPRVYL